MSMSFFDAPTETDWLLSMPAPPQPASQAAATKAPLAGAELPAPKRPRRAGAGASPADQDSARRTMALEQWSSVLERIAGSCQSLHTGPQPDPEELADHMATKKTGTLLIRASAWRLFLRFADEQKIDAHNLTEAEVYQYLAHLRKSGAPASRAKAFIQACGFAYGLSGFKAGASVMASQPPLSRCLRALPAAQTSTQAKGPA